MLLLWHDLLSFLAILRLLSSLPVITLLASALHFQLLLFQPMVLVDLFGYSAASSGSNFQVSSDSTTLIVQALPHRGRIDSFMSSTTFPSAVTPLYVCQTTPRGRCLGYSKPGMRVLEWDNVNVSSAPLGDSDTVVPRVNSDGA